MKHLNKIFILLSIITLIGINKIEAQNVIWAEDFTNGIPAAWMTMDNNGNNYDWVINDQSIVNDTSSPAGITNTTPIASGSGGNHMLLWGGEYNRLAGTNIDLDSYFQTSGIAITGQPSYTVNFQQKFKRCCANTGIEVNLVVSTDPTFATNVSTFDIVGGVATNVQSADPMNMSIDISSIVGGVTGIFYMRFHVAAGSTSYYWMIDDITVETCATNSNFTTIDNSNGNHSFVNTSSGNFYTYWNFGDGIISNLVNPNHTFLANGTFMVELISTNLAGTCTDYEIVFVQVTGVVNPVQCNAAFVMVPDAINPGNVIVYHTSTGNNLTYLWDFGDGNSSTLASPNYTYSTAGPFQLCVSIDDGAGCTSTYCDSINSGGVVLKTGGFNINVQVPVITSIENEHGSLSELNIYPNPFKNDVTIDLNLLKSTQTEIFVTDVVGNRVAQISNEVLSVGDNSFNWKATDIANGVYLLNIKTDNSLQVKKLILNK